MDRIAEYQEGYAWIVVDRDGGDLVFTEDLDDNGRSIVTETRMPISDFVVRGVDSSPWYDLGQRRPGALLVLAALDIEPPQWTEPLPPDVFQMFERARNGWETIAESLAAGLSTETEDPTGATPLWWAVGSLNPAAMHVLVDAGADVDRRIVLTADGTKATTIREEMARLGRTGG